MKAWLVALVVLVVVALPASATTSRILATQDWWPVQSPSANVVAFTRVFPNHMELWTVDTDTHRVTHVGTAAGQLFPTWRADGDIAYSSGGVIWVAHADGSGKHRFLAAPGASAPAARPGSEDIAYVAHGELRVGATVWADDVIGHPAWDASGKLLAFRRDDGVYVADGSGEVTKAAGAFEPGDPVWSPSSDTLAFAAGTSLIVKPLDGQAYEAATGRPDISGIAWAPDGKRVALSWRGGVDEILLPGHASHRAATAGAGVAYTSEGILEYSGPRSACPGHFGIVLGAVSETGSCLVSGTARADVIEGTLLWGDVIDAGAGNDQIHANDGHSDRVNCGPGRDTVWADRSDRLTGCEIVHR